MSNSERKKIILMHNGYEIPVEIEEDYDKALENIKAALYLTQEEMNKLTINFKDMDDDENMLEESNFDDAYNSNVWTTSKNALSNDEDQEEKEVKEEDKNKIINETRESCIKFMNEKIKETNKKWKSKIEDLKIKFQQELEKREILNQSTIDNIIKTISNNAKEEIKNKVNNYNNNIETILNSKIQDSIANLNKEKEKFSQNEKDILKAQGEIKKTVADSKLDFSKIMNYSQAEKK